MQRKKTGTTHLKKYLEDNGVVKKWFGNQLGLSKASLSDIITGRRGVPIKYWTKITLLTRGKITYEDLLEMNTTFKENYERRKSAKKIRESGQNKDNSQLSEEKGEEQTQQMGRNRESSHSISS